jgi:hypothetical protein
MICITLVILSLFWVYEQQKYRRRIALQALTKAGESELAKQHLGAPLRMGYFIRGRIIGGMDSGTADLAIPVLGPNGNGTLVDWSQNGFAGWHICSLKLQLDSGSKIVLVPDETSTCERE